MVIPFAVAGSWREIRSWTLRELLRIGLSGLFLALHFALWISSLKYTSVASSLLLVTTTPIYVCVASWMFLRERPSAWTALGVAASVAGAWVIAAGDRSSGGDSLFGDLLAIGGAVAMAAHLLIGRRLRQRMSALPYVAGVDVAAALLLVAGCRMADVPLAGYPGRTYLLAFLLALFPQILGHATFNWALRRISPSFVSVSLLGEPVLGSLIAYLLLSEPVAPSAWAGGPVVMAGILLAARGERKIQNSKFKIQNAK
jgi:drug/metabolite transporter (DMT)-like permease